MQTEMQEFEKVERHYVKEWGHHVIHVSDYDALLAYTKDVLSEHSRQLAIKDAQIQVLMKGLEYGK